MKTELPQIYTLKSTTWVPIHPTRLSKPWVHIQATKQQSSESTETEVHTPSSQIKCTNSTLHESTRFPRSRTYRHWPKRLGQSYGPIQLAREAGEPTGQAQRRRWRRWRGDCAPPGARARWGGTPCAAGTAAPSSPSPRPPLPPPARSEGDEAASSRV